MTADDLPDRQLTCMFCVTYMTVVQIKPSRQRGSIQFNWVHTEKNVFWNTSFPRGRTLLVIFRWKLCKLVVNTIVRNQYQTNIITFVTISSV